MRKKKTQIIKGRSENGDTTSNFTEIKKIVRKYYGQLYADKLDSLDEMDKWLNKLSKLTQKEIENLTEL